MEIYLLFAAKNSEMFLELTILQCTWLSCLLGFVTVVRHWRFAQDNPPDESRMATGRNHPAASGARSWDSPTERRMIMSNTCTYGLPQCETDALANLVSMVLRMNSEERAQLMKAGEAIELVRELKNMATPA